MSKEILARVESGVMVMKGSKAWGPIPHSGLGLEGWVEPAQAYVYTYTQDTALDLGSLGYGDLGWGREIKTGNPVLVTRKTTIILQSRAKRRKAT